MSKPFVHFFETPKGKYFYDVNTNAIVRVTSRLYEYLNGEIEHFLDNADVAGEIETLTLAGMLSADKWERIEHPETRLLKEHLDGSIESLTLQFHSSAIYGVSIVHIPEAIIIESIVTHV